MFLTLTLVLTLLLFVLWEVKRRRSHSWRELSKFPGDYPWPLIGNALQLGFDADEASEKLVDMWRRLGKSNFRITVGPEDWVLLCEPDDIGTMLSSASELAKPPERNAAMMPFFGNSVSTSEGERWRSMRKLMTPSFHFKTLESKVDAVNKRCDQLIDILEGYAEGDPVDFSRYVRPLMFDVLSSTLMGVDYQMLNDPDHPYIVAIGKVISIVTTNYFSYWRKIHALFSLTSSYREMMETISTIKTMSTKIIGDRRKILQKMLSKVESNNKHIDVELQELMHDKVSEDACLLDTLMLSKFPNGEPITDEMINEEISLLCFTGQYTTSVTVCNTLYCLAKFPKIQQRVFEEQRNVFGSDFLRNPTNQDLKDMKYLEAVIKESMRYIPTVTKIGRQLKDDLKLKDGRIIPGNTTVIIFYDALFRNDKVYPEPEKYNPDRFLENRHVFEFAIFSAGPRNCVGFRLAWLAMKATLSHILRRYEVCEGGPGTEPKFASRIVTESTNGIRLKINKRHY